MGRDFIDLGAGGGIWWAPVDDDGGAEGAAGDAGNRAGTAAGDDVQYFVGEYGHALDDKGRVFMPAVFRPALGDGCFVSWGRDGSVAVYTPAEFARVAEEVVEMARGSAAAAAAADAFFAAASQVALDRQGRIMVAERLLEYAGLARSGHVTITGTGRRIQLWAEDRWKKRHAYASGAIENDPTLSNFGY